MAKPTPGSLRALKKVARYLLGTKHVALHSFRQTFPSSISTYVDSDFAGCRSTRRSTTGMVQMAGQHAVKHTSNLQGATGLSVSECEYYALTHGAAHGLGLKAYMADLGFEMSLHIFSDTPRTGTSATRANTLPVALGASRCSTSHSTQGQNYAEPSGQPHKGSKQRNTSKAQEDVRTQTCRSSQQPEGTQTGESGQKEHSSIMLFYHTFFGRVHFSSKRAQNRLLTFSTMGLTSPYYDSFRNLQFYALNNA